MRGIRSTVILVIVGLGIAVESQEYGGHALFVRTPSAAAGKEDTGGLSKSPLGSIAHSRVQRAAPASPADVMAQNILEWIQGIYRQGARKIRQQEGYLPPYSTQRPPERPRPFLPASPGTNYPGNHPSSVTMPPYSTPKPTYLPPSQTPYGPSTSYNPRPSSQQPTYSNPGSTAFPPVRGSTGGSATYLGPQPGFTSTTVRPSSTQSPSSIGFSTGGGISTSFGSTGFDSSSSGGGYSTGGYSASGVFSTPGGFSTAGTASTPGFSSTFGYSSQRPTSGFPTTLDGDVVASDGFRGTSGFTTSYGSSGYPSERPTIPFPTGGGTAGTGYDVTGGGYPPSTPGGRPFPPFTTPRGTGRPGTGTGTTVTGGTGTGTATGGGGDAGEEGDDDANHPPHIHSLDVECSKTMMTINIEFNRAYDGIIYSKGFFMNPECRYVDQNTGQTQYSFTVNLDSCGTQFINDFEGEAGQAYLENVLVLQNEPGIQEVWDTVRRVRCLWEGNINKALSVNFSVDMLNQETVTFSGDTATARLDIQLGRGPFAPAADGLVKIGETMTLVVSVEGDPAFDLQVRACTARDESQTNVVELTDERGCILKPKLFGAFQKTNDTGNTGASIIAYAFFQAFKFPDVMDLFIECNVELCKTDCDPCPEENQQIDPGRRRRSISYMPSASNTTSPVLLTDPIRVGRGLKVIMLDDLSPVTNRVLEQLEETAIATDVSKQKDVCISNTGFYTAFSLILSTLLTTSIIAAVFYVKLQRVHRMKVISS